MFKRCNRYLALVITVLCFFTLTFSQVSAATEPSASSESPSVSESSSSAPSGWIDVRVNVPDIFGGVIIVSVENLETLEPFDFEVLSVNGYRSSASVPEGEYRVMRAFVYQNIEYRVEFPESTFLVKEDSAAHVLNFVVSKIEPEPSTAPTPTVEETSPTESGASLPTESPEGTKPSSSEPTADSSVQSSEPTPDTTESQSKSDTGSPVKSFAERVLLVGFGTGLFVALTFLVAYLIRRKNLSE